MSQEDYSALTMLNTALQMEEKGYRFYEKAVAKCETKLGKEIFTMLRDDEVLHMKRIKQIYENLEGNKPWNEEWQEIKANHEDLTVLFRKMALDHAKSITSSTSDLEALDVGIDFEAKAVKYYEDQLGFSSDPIEQSFIRRMIDEEKDHHAALTDMKLFYTDPSAWYMENERSLLDGA